MYGCRQSIKFRFYDIGAGSRILAPFLYRIVLFAI